MTAKTAKNAFLSIPETGPQRASKSSISSRQIVTMGDDLFTPKAHYFLGNFQLAINEAMTIIPIDSNVAIEREVLVMRAHIAQKNFQASTPHLSPCLKSTVGGESSEIG